MTASGTKRTSSDVRLESAFRGKTDYMCSERVFRLLTHLGHWAIEYSSFTILAEQY
jgi:hypothetical protein